MLEHNSEPSGYYLLRGSRAGICATYDDGSRNTYYYHFGEYLGKRMLREYLRSGRCLFTINTRDRFFANMRWQVERKFKAELNHAFVLHSKYVEKYRLLTAIIPIKDGSLLVAGIVDLGKPDAKMLGSMVHRLIEDLRTTSQYELRIGEQQ